MPDSDEMRVEADRQPNTTELIIVVQHTLQLLADGQQLHPGPEVRSVNLSHAKGPTSAVDVAAILPDWAEALLEEVDRLAHFDLVNGCVVVVAPEVLNRLYLRTKLLELGDVWFAISWLGFVDLSMRVIVRTLHLRLWVGGVEEYLSK